MSKDRTYASAIHILVVFATTSDQRMSSDYLAMSLQTNAGLVRRLLAKLSKAGLVDSARGPNGGSQLAIPAESINLKMIYEATHSGPLFHSFEKPPFKVCAVSSQIGDVLRGVYHDLESGVLVKMEKTLLSEIAAKIK